MPIVQVGASYGLGSEARLLESRQNVCFSSWSIKNYQKENERYKNVLKELHHGFLCKAFKIVTTLKLNVKKGGKVAHEPRRPTRPELNPVSVA